MKKYKAKVCFAGTVSMYEGEVRELPKEVASDLVSCGYIEEVEAEIKQKPKGGKNNDSKSSKR